MQHRELPDPEEVVFRTFQARPQRQRCNTGLGVWPDVLGHLQPADPRWRSVWVERQAPEKTHPARRRLTGVNHSVAVRHKGGVDHTTSHHC